jgi:hypothetical protein
MDQGAHKPVQTTIKAFNGCMHACETHLTAPQPEAVAKGGTSRSAEPLVQLKWGWAHWPPASTW